MKSPNRTMRLQREMKSSSRTMRLHREMKSSSRTMRLQSEMKSSSWANEVAHFDDEAQAVESDFSIERPGDREPIPGEAISSFNVFNKHAI